KVASEIGTQARDLLGQAKTGLVDQAGTQQERLATGLRSIGEELASMGNSTAEPGVATEIVRQAGQRTSDVADWLSARDPGSLVEEMKTFARQRPGTFIAIAALAGVVVGRLTKAVVSNKSEAGSERTAGGDFVPTGTVDTGAYASGGTTASGIGSTSPYGAETVPTGTGFGSATGSTGNVQL
ncbi:MAG: hypothetical protein JWP30_63, partial [Homoserinimonas sp.]|nr:hypothetical protein [Homoserinimonas sp.]